MFFTLMLKEISMATSVSIIFKQKAVATAERRIRFSMQIFFAAADSTKITGSYTFYYMTYEFEVPKG